MSISPSLAAALSLSLLLGALHLQVLVGSESETSTEKDESVEADA